MLLSRLVQLLVSVMHVITIICNALAVVCVVFFWVHDGKYRLDCPCYLAIMPQLDFGPNYPSWSYTIHEQELVEYGEECLQQTPAEHSEVLDYFQSSVLSRFTDFDSAEGRPNFVVNSTVRDDKSHADRNPLHTIITDMFVLSKQPETYDPASNYLHPYLRRRTSGTLRQFIANFLERMPRCRYAEKLYFTIWLIIVPMIAIVGVIYAFKGVFIWELSYQLVALGTLTLATAVYIYCSNLYSRARVDIASMFFVVAIGIHVVDMLALLLHILCFKHEQKASSS
ncbi:unnamed protein product, partial [Mesorhabditis spiculigera]